MMEPSADSKIDILKVNIIIFINININIFYRKNFVKKMKNYVKHKKKSIHFKIQLVNIEFIKFITFINFRWLIKQIVFNF